MIVDEKDFLSFITIKKGLSKQSIRHCIIRLRVVNLWFADKELTKENLEQFFMEYKDKGRKNNSLNTYYFVFRHIRDYFLDRGLVSESHFMDGFKSFKKDKADIVTIAGDVALDQLRNILLVLNGGFLIIIPIVSWFLARRTLRPIEFIHEQQKQFVSDASHELKTPLAIMYGEMEVILKKSRTQKDYLQTILSNKEEVGRLSKLVENLLFLAGNEQKKYVFQTTSVDITDVVNTVRSQLKQRIKEKELTVKFEPAKENAVIQGEEGLLQQLFFNLLDNAVKYTPKKGTIIVRLFVQKQFIEVRIVDTGIGISQHDQEKIIDRFYRVDMSRSETKGYGLGLSVAKTIVEKHNGEIALTSQEGEGTTVIVTLPYV